MKTYSIVSIHEVFEDNFENGEGKHINTYDLNEVIKADNVQDAINKYLEYTVFTELQFKDLEISDCGNFLNTERLVDIKSEDATNKEIESWKQGKIKLFNEIIHLNALEVFELVQINFKP